VEDVPIWDIGMDYNTTADGMSYLAILDHTANAGAGADIVSISPEFQSSISATCKFGFGIIGPPEDLPDFMTISGGDDTTPLGGIKLYHFSDDATRHALHLMQRDGTSNRADINFNDLWDFGTDRDSDGGQEIGFSTGGVTHWTLLSPGQVSQTYRDAGTTNAPYAYRLNHTSSGTAAAGFGVGMQFYGQDSGTTEIEIGTISAVESAVGAGAVNCSSYLSFGTLQAATGMLEALRLKPTGETTVRYDLKQEGTKIGFFNTATVVQQAGASAAGIAAIADANALAAVQALQAALAAYGLVTSPA
jgi:hypothetical protein